MFAEGLEAELERLLCYSTIAFLGFVLFLNCTCMPTHKSWGSEETVHGYVKFTLHPATSLSPGSTLGCCVLSKAGSGALCRPKDPAECPNGVCCQAKHEEAPPSLLLSHLAWHALSSKDARACLQSRPVRGRPHDAHDGLPPCSIDSCKPRLLHALAQQTISRQRRSEWGGACSLGQ